MRTAHLGRRSRLAIFVLVCLALASYIIMRGKRPEPAPGQVDQEAFQDDLSDGRSEVTVDLRDGTSDDELKAFGTRHHLDLHWAAKDPSIVRAAIALARVPIENQLAVLKELRQDPLVEHAEHNGLMSIPDQGSFSEFSGTSADVIDEEDAGKPREGFPNDGLL